MGDQQLIVRKRKVGNFSQCRWIHRAVQCLKFIGYGASLAQVQRLLRCMPRLTRLRSLVLSDCDQSPFPVELLRDGLLAAASTLTSLDLALFASLEASPAVAVWSAVRTLTKLVSLNVNLEIRAGLVESLGVELDFSCLPSMLQLERLHFRLGYSDWICSVEQVEALARCKALTDLHCATWLPSMRGVSADAQSHDQQASLTRGRFAQLIQRRKEVGAAPLRRLRLGALPLIDSVGLQLLLQCTELESIAADWIGIDGGGLGSSGSV